MEKEDCTYPGGCPYLGSGKCEGRPYRKEKDNVDNNTD